MCENKHLLTTGPSLFLALPEKVAFRSRIKFNVNLSLAEASPHSSQSLSLCILEEPARF